MTDLTGMTNLSLEFTKHNLPLPGLHMLFQHPVMGDQGNLTTIPGFNISWSIKGSSHLMLGSKAWTPLSFVPKWQDTLLIRTVAMSEQARVMEISKDFLIQTAIQHKEELVISNFGDTTDFCFNEKVTEKYFFNLLQSLSDKLGTSFSNTTTSPRQEDIEVGFEVFALLIHCSTESLGALQFLENLIDSATPAPSYLPLSTPFRQKEKSSTNQFGMVFANSTLNWSICWTCNTVEFCGPFLRLQSLLL